MPRPNATVRWPAVAGAFYPADAADVVADARRFVAPAGSAPARPAIAAVCPHAGWTYSGALAGKLAAAVEVPARVLVLAPNHTGRGARGAVWPGGSWRLPGADVPVDAAVCRALCVASTLLEPDVEAHLDEHAVEVLVPLLAARQPALHLVPVVLSGLSFGECEALAAALARTIRAATGPTLIIASSDMNHYRSETETHALDALALAPLEALDAQGLYATVRANGITMCGVVPATVAILAARALGATRATRVGYATSADAGGDRRRVVGYAAVRIS
ncbi:MAG TPA: AmmeMemoRadiSam system protein B [Polyangia bacterium]|nr:AmmeMemoRadiSam system protein B [Polyangia bacterium]